jgi:hypothetical protein
MVALFTLLQDTEGIIVRIFVFGSNLAGRHGKGAALYALKNYGAEYGVGIGRRGNSYAIPTKDAKLRVLPIGIIRAHVDVFINYALDHPELEFELTRIGCGLAGYKDFQMEPLFRTCPDNVIKPEEWRRK